MAYLQQHVSLLKCLPITYTCKFQRSTCNRVYSFSRSSPYIQPMRKLSAKQDLSLAEGNLSSADFKVVYRFPYIRVARLVTRMKLYQTGVTVIAIPPAFYAYASGIVGLNSCLATVFVGTFASVMLIIMSNFLQRFIGLVAVSESLPYARLSHLTFWGKRHDVLVPCDDIVPISDVSENTNDIYLKVRRYSTKDIYYLSLRFGHVENEHELQKLLGSLSNQ